MVKIIDNSELEVTKLKNSIKFNIKKSKFQPFYKTIKDILGVKNNTITARNIIGFNDYIKSGVFLYKHADQMFLNLSMQIKKLEKENLGMLYLDPTDIYYIEINENQFYFLLLKTDKLQVIKDQKLEIVTPMKEKNGMFFSPELKTLKTFPVNISYKTCYYSLAMLIVNSLKPVANADIELKDHIESLYKTRLYWALERCLHKSYENRTLLYI
jgi:hypothetical protein|tara:strand:+ start:395 stop:1033 length:639 start_codon:yes stop_codon:yes gene_type:complete